MSEESLWEIADSHKKAGRPPIYKTPSDLWAAAISYFKWVDDNPLMEYRVAQSSGEPTVIPLPKLRAMTLDGFCLHAGISDETWYNYKKKDEFIGVSKEIDRAFRDQKFSGAAAGLLNPNIIARDLGLREATTNEHTGAEGGPIKSESTVVVATMTNEEASNIYKDLLG